MDKTEKEQSQARVKQRTRSVVIDPAFARKLLRLVRGLATLPRSARHIISKLETKIADSPEQCTYVRLAQQKHSGDEGDVEVDQDAAVSIGEDGAYVQAWTFVSKDDLSQSKS